MSLAIERNVGFFTARFCCAVLALAVASFGARAAGESAPTEKQDSAWTKQCNDVAEGEKQTCLTSQVLYNARGLLFASLAVETVSGRKDPRILIAVPNGIPLVPGLVLQVDDALSKKIDFRICFSDRCFADMQTDSAFLGRMRRGTVFKIGLVNPEHKATTLTFPLDGFSAVLDGRATAPETAVQ